MRDRANALSPQCVGETVARIISSILFQFQVMQQLPLIVYQLCYLDKKNNVKYNISDKDRNTIFPFNIENNILILLKGQILPNI